MLTSLAVFLLFMLSACTLTLLLCGAYDTYAAKREAGSRRLAGVESSALEHMCTHLGACAAVIQRPRARRMPAVNQRSVVHLIASQRKSRLHRTIRRIGSKHWLAHVSDLR
jgi:hypothetical protein